MPARLLIVDDHRVFSQGLETVFAAEPDFEPTTVTSPQQTLAVVMTYRPHAVLMDVRLGDISGIELTRRLALLPSAPAVVALTAYADIATAAEVIQAGAVGFLGKDASIEQVICAVRAAVLGGTWLPAGMLGKLLADCQPAADRHQELIGHLTAREQQVLSLLVSGLDRNGIAANLHQSPNTVRTHIRNVMVKLGCHSAIEAAAIGLRAGLRP